MGMSCEDGQSRVTSQPGGLLHTGLCRSGVGTSQVCVYVGGEAGKDEGGLAASALQTVHTVKGFKKC